MISSTMRSALKWILWDGEVSFWEPQVRGQGRQAVATDFPRSNEYRTRIVRNAFYGTLLHRSPSESELRFWVLSGRDLDTIRSEIKSSLEFFFRG